MTPERWRERDRRRRLREGAALIADLERLVEAAERCRDEIDRAHATMRYEVEMRAIEARRAR